MTELCLGIDLGTTYSAVKSTNGPVKLDYAADVSPSAVVVHEDEWQLLSADTITDGSAPILRLAKRIIGRTRKDRKLEDDLSGIPFAELSDDGAHFVVSGQSVAPEEVTGFIFGKIKAEIDRQGLRLGRVFLAMPAYFNFQQRRATMVAAEVGGFEPDTINLIEEPVAVVLDYMSSHPEKEKCSAVVDDFGGGTFDLTCVTYERTPDGGAEVVVQGTGGNTRLGGADIDMALCKLVKKKCSQKLDDKPDDKLDDKLVMRCQTAKHQFCNGIETTSITMPGTSKRVQVTKKEFEDACQPIINKVAKVFDDFLSERRDAMKVEVVITVGGGCRQSEVRGMHHKIPGATHIHMPNPELSVANGALIAADNPNIKIKNVLPRSIGIESRNLQTGELHNDIVMKRNAPLPIPLDHKLQTNGENQRELEFTILEGESANVHETSLVGEFRLSISPETMHEVKHGTDIKIDGRIHSPGHLTMTATVEGTKEQITIKQEDEISRAQIKQWQRKTQLRIKGMVEDAPESEMEINDAENNRFAANGGDETGMAGNRGEDSGITRDGDNEPPTQEPDPSCKTRSDPSEEQQTGAAGVGADHREDNGDVETTRISAHSTAGCTGPVHTQLSPGATGKELGNLSETHDQVAVSPQANESGEGPRLETGTTENGGEDDLHDGSQTQRSTPSHTQVVGISETDHQQDDPPQDSSMVNGIGTPADDETGTSAVANEVGGRTSGCDGNESQAHDSPCPVNGAEQPAEDLEAGDQAGPEKTPPNDAVMEGASRERFTSARFELVGTPDGSSEQIQLSEDVFRLIDQAENIIVIAGAGMSTAAGIPVRPRVGKVLRILTKRQDFCDGGRYETIERMPDDEPAPKRRKGHTNGQKSITRDLLHASILSTPEGQGQFLKTMTELKAKFKTSAPTVTHRYLKQLKEEGRLLRCYTQNFDGLEEQAGLEPASDVSSGDLLYCHGSIGQLRCRQCSMLAPWDESMEKVTTKGETSDCPNCTHDMSQKRRLRSAERPGQLLPNIVLYDEVREDRQQTLMTDCIARDTEQEPDLILVLGTRLRPQSSQHIMKDFARAVHNRRNPGTVIYINRERPREGLHKFIDYHIGGDCDAWAKDMDRGSHKTDEGGREATVQQTVPRISGPITHLRG